MPYNSVDVSRSYSNGKWVQRQGHDLKITTTSSYEAITFRVCFQIHLHNSATKRFEYIFLLSTSTYTCMLQISLHTVNVHYQRHCKCWILRNPYSQNHYSTNPMNKEKTIKKIKITQHDLSHKYHEAGIRTYVSNGK